MTLKELAHLAQQTLQTRAGCPVRRSHVHELLAAAFGHGSWAAFLSDSVLADSGVGAAPTGGLPDLIGRAVQLGYEQQAAASVATTLQAFIAEHGLSAVSLADLRAALLPTAQVADRDDLDDDDDDDEGWDDEPPRAASPASGPAREQLLGSPMLLSSLEQAAGLANPQGHFLLAALYRCGRPNPYLYEESLKGRVLTAIERGWVDDYLRLEPQYRKYEAHLKAAALGGVRAAALEYGTTFENPEFIALAERLTGEVDALKMARHASSDEARARWLRAAAEQGSRAAMEALASEGDAWAEDRVAEWADDHWLRSAAERALDAGNVVRAWTWQYLALEHGVDLTRSTMAAYHDGGERDGQFYDSDFGGPLYAGGDEGLVLPDLDPSSHEVAKAKAEAIFSRAR
ncbi:MAG: hypothetical protein HUU30_08990 [Burkholderiaceae bacterium]|nr:hypothetical protein [Aquabacterium sp.]NUP85872.1 hypothetical protein [Burkholderiaceae bacterium]